MTDWSGQDYAQVSNLQRVMATEALASLRFRRDGRVLDIGCGDGYLTRAVVGLVPDGFAVGVDASPRMIATAHAGARAGPSGPWFVVGDARRLPFAEYFDAVVSFNALLGYPVQRALSEIASVLHEGGRARPSGCRSRSAGWPWTGCGAGTPSSGAPVAPRPPARRAPHRGWAGRAARPGSFAAGTAGRSGRRGALPRHGPARARCPARRPPPGRP